MVKKIVTFLLINLSIFAQNSGFDPEDYGLMEDKVTHKYFWFVDDQNEKPYRIIFTPPDDKDEIKNIKLQQASRFYALIKAKLVKFDSVWDSLSINEFHLSDPVFEDAKFDPNFAKKWKPLNSCIKVVTATTDYVDSNRWKHWWRPYSTLELKALFFANIDYGYWFWNFLNSGGISTDSIDADPPFRDKSLWPGCYIEINDLAKIDDDPEPEIEDIDGEMKVTFKLNGNPKYRVPSNLSVFVDVMVPMYEVDIDIIKDKGPRPAIVGLGEIYDLIDEIKDDFDVEDAFKTHLEAQFDPLTNYPDELIQWSINKRITTVSEAREIVSATVKVYAAILSSVNPGTLLQHVYYDIYYEGASPWHLLDIIPYIKPLKNL
ncbi:MAG: hypothetical protein HRT89_23485, partial [Lentisphaeria bacterium]|nr:hypothetical protein [Lentisphaeria bacterium]